jgi:hypothetical protein
MIGHDRSTVGRGQPGDGHVDRCIGRIGPEERIRDARTP